jgi:hypothetical protein
LTDFVFFYVKFTVFRRGHTGFATIDTFVIIFTSVTTMVLLRTTSVIKAFFTSVEAQTDMPWPNREDKPTRLTVKTTEKYITASKKVTNSSQKAMACLFGLPPR